MKKLGIVYLFILLLFITGCGKVQNTTEGEPFTFEGIVYQTDYDNNMNNAVASNSTVNIVSRSILADAGVKVLSTGESTITNKKGTFGFVEVPRGEFVIEVRKEGYLPKTVTVDAGAFYVNLETSEQYWPQTDKWQKYFKQLGDSVATANLMVKLQLVRNKDYIQFTKTKANKTHYSMWFTYDSNKQQLILVKCNNDYNLQDHKPIFENDTNYEFKKVKDKEGAIFLEYPISIGKVLTADIIVKGQKIGLMTTVVEKYFKEFLINNIKYKNVAKFTTRNDFLNGNYQESIYWLAPKIGIIKMEENPAKYAIEIK